MNHSRDHTEVLIVHYSSIHSNNLTSAQWSWYIPNIWTQNI